MGRYVLFSRDWSQHTSSDYRERQNVPGAAGQCLNLERVWKRNVTYLNTELKLVILGFKSRLVTSVEHGRKICCRK
jgi:hypothetical protein